VNVQEHFIQAEHHYARARHHTTRQAYDAATRELLAANYHATMVLATAKIAELETGR
jgi:hypothetical protein